MEIFIDLHGMRVEQGLWSPAGSEFRQSMNWAKLLAENGHEITCWCSAPCGWGSMPPVNNVRLVYTNEYFNTDYDIFINTHLNPNKNVKARLKMQMSFSIGAVNAFSYDFNVNEWVVVYPLEQLNSKGGFFSKEERALNNYKIEFLPLPISNEMRSSNPDSNLLLWSCKTGVQRSDELPFRSMIEFLKKYNVESTILQSQNFHMYNQSESDRNKVKQELASLPRQPRMLNQIDYKDVLDLFATARLNLHSGAWGLNLTESIVRGVLPPPINTGVHVSMFGHIDNKFYKEPYSQDVNVVVENWGRLISDKSFYSEVLSEYQKDFQPHLYASCMEHFNNILKKYFN